MSTYLATKNVKSSGETQQQGTTAGHGSNAHHQNTTATGSSKARQQGKTARQDSEARQHENGEVRLQGSAVRRSSEASQQGRTPGWNRQRPETYSSIGSLRWRRSSWRSSWKYLSCYILFQVRQGRPEHANTRAHTHTQFSRPTTTATANQFLASKAFVACSSSRAAGHSKLHPTKLAQALRGFCRGADCRAH